MSKKNKLIFLDPESITYKNIELFNKSLEWPLQEKDFQIFSNRLYKNYYELISKTAKEVFYIGLIEVSMIANIINICHYNYVIRYCKKNNIKLLCSSQSETLRSPNWEKKLSYIIASQSFL